MFTATLTRPTISRDFYRAAPPTGADVFIRSTGTRPVAAVGSPKAIRVLVVDDSRFMQRRLVEIIGGTPDMEVVACADNGLDALHLAERLAPDVITMDINMAKMDGLEAIGHIMRSQPRPIVVISSYTRQGGKAAMYALELGVVDIVEKPSTGGVALDITDLSAEIVRKVRTAARVRVVRNLGLEPSFATNHPTPARPVAAPANAASNSVNLKDAQVQMVAIGTSTGGPAVLRELVKGLPRDFAHPLLIVQHLPPKFTRDLAEQLSALSPIRVVEATDGEELRGGRGYLAPGGRHMEVDGQNRIRLSDAPPVCHCRPSVNVLFHSLARHYGARVLGFVLTGMGDDGALGALDLRRSGATIVAQDEASSIVFGMPKAVIDAGAASAVMSLDEIGRLLNQASHAAASRPPSPAPAATTQGAI